MHSIYAKMFSEEVSHVLCWPPTESLSASAVLILQPDLPPVGKWKELLPKD